MIISASKITTKRQITLPLKIMVSLKLHPGDPVIFEEKDGHVELKSRTAKFTIADFVKKYLGHTTKKLTDAQIRKAREESWSEGNS